MKMVFVKGPRCAAVALAALSVPLLSGCPQKNNAPKTASLPPADYEAAVRAFYTGTIAFQVGNDARADKELILAAQAAPDEPAVWANLGLFRMRQGNLAEAETALAKARVLAPENSAVALLSGILLSRQGKFDEAIAAFQQSAKTDGQNLRARYALAQTLERKGGPEGDKAFALQINEILTAAPTNLLALLESARASARAGDKAVLDKRVVEIAAQTKTAPPEVQAQVQAVRKAAQGTDIKRAAIEIVKLKNVLSRVPRFRTDSEALELSARDIAPPITQFLALPAPPVTAAPPDMKMTFVPVPVAQAGGIAAQTARTVPVDQSATAVLATDGKTAKRVGVASPVTAVSVPGSLVGATQPQQIAPLDFNSDYQMDLALAGSGGFRLLQGDKINGYKDVTTSAKIPAALAKAAYNGAWAYDTDADGDLDLVLGTMKGPPPVLQNNGDGTFTSANPFAAISNGLRGFAWADVRGDGVSDAALVDASGVLHVLKNERSGKFTPRPVGQMGKVLGITVADADGDGLLDFVVWQESGQVTALCDAGDDAAFRAVPLFQAKQTGANPRLLTGDFDANGTPDYAVSAGGKTEVWLSDEKRGLHVLPDVLRFAAQDIIYPDKDGVEIAFAGVDAGKKAVLARAKGTLNYHAQVLRPRAAERAGDQRINSFGVGGEVEVRAGLLYQKVPIAGPTVRYGLGTQARADYARILWPNGSNQGEFDLQAGQVIPVEQRLKGSCPFLFAWNGKEMAFVTDCIWRSPLGLRINAQNTAGVAMTEDRVKLRADQLVAKNGFYELAVTAELWETHYFDHLSLMTVDHPAHTDIWVDERFAIPPPPLEVGQFGMPHALASAHDGKGADVTDILRKRDGIHLDTFGRGKHQGITRPHYLEIDLGQIPKNKPVYLIANGWIHPTDSSTNIAVAQGSGEKPSGLALQVQSASGAWKTAKPALGFPSGKVKTVLIRLDDALLPGTHKIRLQTNLEIYWDEILWAEKLPQAPRMRKLAASEAELYFRGFPVVKAKDASSPELPVSFSQTQGTAPLWRDLSGYYTRFGDIRALVATVDDRYVIMNAGDAMRLRYKVPPPPPAGWQRDFVMVSDGWEKDGDYNTGFGRTVLPLPSHNSPAYNTPPRRLEDDPVYKKHKSDWQTYHTRYVTPRPFTGALVPTLKAAQTIK